MIVAALCPRCLAYRYRAEVPPGTAPLPEDYAPLPPQVTPPVAGTKVTCDVCAGDVKFVRGDDWDMMQRQLRPGSAPLDAPPGVPSNGAAPRLSVAPAAFTELFRVERDEELRDLRALPGDRLLIITTKRIAVLDPHAIPEVP